MTPLRATIRLQLHAGFDFSAAQAQLDYFADLGISHLYLSPIAEAMPGSTHGYDGIDPTRVSAALGGEGGFVRLAQAARAQGMGILLDIVPNHLAADVRNPWWADVLANGRRSAYADWFDIDWEAPGCNGQLWLPVLDRPLDELLAEGVIRVEPGSQGPQLAYGEHYWPLSPLGIPEAPGAQMEWIARSNQSPTHLQRLLDHQAYRLAWWRSGPDRVNYRRFFDINQLAAVRVERPAAYDAMHALPLRLVREGWVDGLRIDHVDGLADPAGYLQTLRHNLDEAGAVRGLPPGALSLHVEKILAEGESLPEGWPCDGTTGYDFMDQVGALLHDPRGQPAFDTFWTQVSGSRERFPSVQRQARTELLGSTLQADMDRCLRQLQAAVQHEGATGDLTPRMYERATQALLRHFPVYRSYGMASATDQQVLRQAAEAARAELDAGDRAALTRVCSALGHEHGEETEARSTLRTRIEQLAAPLNAKAVEDTAFYRYGRLLSRNEVGSDPDYFALTPSAFVARATERGTRFPRAMLALATHDHKRGPDARMRLALLSARPQPWHNALCRWQREGSAQGHPLPLPGAEAYMLWQTLLSAWPLQRDSVDADFAARIAEWLRKALREGKRLSRWSDPNEALERAAVSWVEWLCGAPTAQALRDDVHAFVEIIAADAARLSLAQLALQLSCPGVPDLYQGNEGWDTSLVDPDNRRPVDYQQRRDWRADRRPWAALLADWHSGAPKARLLGVLLQLRRAQPLLFAQGILHRIDTGADDLLVFTRQRQQQVLLVAVSVRPAAEAEGPAPPRRAGGNDPRMLHLAGVPAGHYRNLLEGASWTHAGHAVPADTLFNNSPLALWIRDVEQQDGT